MIRFRLWCVLIGLGAVPLLVPGAPTINPIPNASIPAGKSLIIPVTASSPNGLPLTFTATSSTNRIAVQVHTNNPFWKMSVVQAAPSNAPGAYLTPFRGGLEMVTNVGDMTFMLFRDIAPRTVDAIQGLTAGGLYTSNTIFHRVIAGFMNQGGDPLTNGMGGPVFRYDDEFNPQALFTGSGQLALANAGKDTDGSQFFITVAPYRYGDFGYTIFGQLLRGFNVLSNINNTPVDVNDRPLADVIITKASLVSDPFDTVLTVTGTTQAGIAGTIKVVADDGAGGRTTNSFVATTVADATIESPFFYPNTVTNVMGPANKGLTNLVFAYDFPGITNNWGLAWADTASTVNATNSNFYLMTNQLFMEIIPNANYIGPVGVTVYVSAYTNGQIYDQQTYTFVFGNTPINATPTNFISPAAGFSNQLLATFTNGVPNSPTNNFTAFINWGDNSTDSGVIATNATLGRKEVRGTHTYTNSGDYPVYVTVQNVFGANTTVVCTSTVPPSLSFSRARTNNTIGWPAWAFAYHLLSGSNLPNATWSSVTNLSSLRGYENVVTNTTAATNAFYRLMR